MVLTEIEQADEKENSVIEKEDNLKMSTTCTRGPVCGCGETCTCVECKYVTHASTLLFVRQFLDFIVCSTILGLGKDSIVLVSNYVLVSVSSCAINLKGYYHSF
jgi:hypothetical protein